jgi:hypothetical protein
MSANVYSIIWADDECATLSANKVIRSLFDSKKIEVLKFVQTSESLRNAMQSYNDKIDAVIIDGNFSKEETEYVEPEDISGLIHSISFIELFNIKRDIPFFLYTARKVTLQKICKNGELDYFINNNRLLQKGNIQELANGIIEAVDHIRSVEFQVKKNYKSLIDVANKIDPKCGEHLWNFLLDEARDSQFNKSISMFNELRSILECIVDLCKGNEITPPEINKLNDFKFYWAGRNGHKCGLKPINDVMPKAIITTLWGLVDITQDGSHNKQDLNLHISEYVFEEKTPFLFRACLYLVMDILRWYNKTINRLSDGSLKPPLYK